MLGIFESIYLWLSVKFQGWGRGLQICLKVTPKQLWVGDEHKAQMTELEKAFHIRSLHMKVKNKLCGRV